MKNKKGFTLLELIMVIGIIGLFMALSTSAFMSARKTSRDAKRKTDLEQIRGALETYKADNNVYPGPNSNPISDPQNVHPMSDIISFIAGSTVYIQTMPTDPISGLLYRYVPKTSGYSLCAYLESSTVASTLSDCYTSTGVVPDCGTLSGNTVPCNYSVKNP